MAANRGGLTPMLAYFDGLAYNKNHRRWRARSLTIKEIKDGKARPKTGHFICGRDETW
jgi:hypothetical protein